MDRMEETHKSNKAKNSFEVNMDLNGFYVVKDGEKKYFPKSFTLKDIQEELNKAA